MPLLFEFPFVSSLLYSSFTRLPLLDSCPKQPEKLFPFKPCLQKALTFKKPFFHLFPIIKNRLSKPVLLLKQKGYFTGFCSPAPPAGATRFRPAKIYTKKAGTGRLQEERWASIAGTSIPSGQPENSFSLNTGR
jgi:hypothetical protein